MKLIILTLAPYKEKDVIVDALGENGIVTFKANGILSPTAKNASINNILTVIDATFSPQKNPNYLFLKESKILFSPYSINMDLDYVTAISLLQEITVKLYSDDEKVLAYPLLLDAIDAMKNKEPFKLIVTKYLCRTFDLTGFAFNVKSCVRCGSTKSIVGFSFEDGGFICKNCMNEYDYTKFSSSELMLLRNIYLWPNFDFKNFIYTEKDIKGILNQLVDFVSDAYGINLISKSLI